MRWKLKPTPTRRYSVLKAIFPWLGGKNRQAANLLPIFAKIARTCYCEPFGGSGAVFCNKTPEFYEVYNDINRLLYIFFKAIRRKDAAESFERLAVVSPQCRAFWHEYRAICLAAYNGDVERVGELIKDANLDDYDPEIVVSFCFLYCMRLGFGGKFLSAFAAGAVGDTRRCYSHEYKHAVERIAEYTRRFDRVTIENLDAFDCLEKYNAPETLFYIDPPYNVECSKNYDVDWTESQTRRLVDYLKTCESSVVISCYNTPIYAELYEAGYIRKDFNALMTVCKTKREPRVETVYYRLSKTAEAERRALRARTYLFQ